MQARVWTRPPESEEDDSEVCFRVHPPVSTGGRTATIPKDAKDTSNFDQEFTSVTPVLTPVQSGKFALSDLLRFE
jgi:hypothetical protein